MLFHLTTEDDIRVIHEQGPAETDASGRTSASEQAFNNLAGEWPMKRLIEIWNRLPGVQALVCAAFVLAFALSLTAQTVHKPTCNSKNTFQKANGDMLDGVLPKIKTHWLGSGRAGRPGETVPRK